MHKRESPHVLESRSLMGIQEKCSISINHEYCISKYRCIDNLFASSLIILSLDIRSESVSDFGRIFFYQFDEYFHTFKISGYISHPLKLGFISSWQVFRTSSNKFQTLKSGRMNFKPLNMISLPTLKTVSEQLSQPFILRWTKFGIIETRLMIFRALVKIQKLFILRI